MAKAYGRRPSEFFVIEDPYAQWCLDEAIYLWGEHVDGSIEKAQQGAKNEAAAQRKVQMVLQTLLRETPVDKQADPYADDPEVDVPHWADYSDDEPLPPMPKPKRKFRDPAEMMKK